MSQSSQIEMLYRVECENLVERYLRYTAVFLAALLFFGKYQDFWVLLWASLYVALHAVFVIFIKHFRHSENTATQYLAIAFSVIVLAALLWYPVYRAIVGPAPAKFASLAILGCTFFYAQARSDRLISSVIVWVFCLSAVMLVLTLNTLSGLNHPVDLIGIPASALALVAYFTFAALNARKQHQIATEARERALHEQKLAAIGRLTGGIAHDFNNLLAVTLGNLELLADEIDDPEQCRRIDASISASLRGADLTRNMLAFAQKARLDPEILDLNQVVLHAQDWMRGALPQSILVETSLSPKLQSVRLDASSLENSLLNLILNARDTMNGKGKLTIATANVNVSKADIRPRHDGLAPGRYAKLEISDTGAGISEDYLVRVFEPYYTTKGPGDGSGLGLSMVKGFVEQSGGSMLVDSKLGEGTTFKLYFPVTRSKRSATLERTIETVPPSVDRKISILLVEDESDIRELLTSAMSKSGYEVIQATGGDDALNQYHSRQSVDVVVTDMVMPGKLQGTELVQELRKLRPDLRVILMSGNDSKTGFKHDGMSSNDIFLTKPFPKDDLLRALAKVLSDEF